MSRYSDYSGMFGMMVCDTPVPYYKTGISCGLPSEFGDIFCINYVKNAPFKIIA